MSENVITEMCLGFAGSDCKDMDRIANPIFSALKYKFETNCADKFENGKNYSVQVKVVELAKDE